MMNRKGSISSALIILVVAVILTIILGIYFIASNKFKFYVIGTVIILTALVYGLKLEKSNRQKTAVMILAILLGAGFILLPGFGLIQSGYIPSNVKLAFPMMTGYACEVVGESNGMHYYLKTKTNEEFLLNKETTNLNTNSYTNINILVSGLPDFFKITLISPIRARLKIQQCNYAGGSCVAFLTKDITYDTSTIPISSLDVTRYSYKIRVEYSWNYGVTWGPTDGGILSIDVKKFGLKSYSTTQNPAGEVICPNSCDLTCPTQGFRDKLLSTSKNSLNFYETVPGYIEYWNTVEYDINQQGGAVAYDSNSNTFCFTGRIYRAATLTTEAGNTYIYPDKNTLVTKQCCPGAVISTSQDNKVCQSDGTWKTIEPDDRIKCISDYNCPRQGSYTCINKIKSGWSINNIWRKAGSIYKLNNSSLCYYH